MKVTFVIRTGFDYKEQDMDGVPRSGEKVCFQDFSATVSSVQWQPDSKESPVLVFLSEINQH
jgi:hypothetical protein